MLTVADLIVLVYCIVDDLLMSHLGNRRLRRRGFAPGLRDSEVLTMEIVGEILGLDSDKEIYAYFVRHWAAWFPALKCRTTFVRQAANLWAIKLALQAVLAEALGAFDNDIHIVDGLPIPICTLTRASRSKCLQGDAAFGYCAAKDMHYFGLKAHLVIDSRGIIAGCAVTPANVDEREAAWESLDLAVSGTLLGDKGYISARFKEELTARGIDLRTPVRCNMKPVESSGETNALCRMRRLVETVGSQLCEQFNIQVMRARDAWHATSRIARKVLAHTVQVFINCKLGRALLPSEGLLVG